MMILFRFLANSQPMADQFERNWKMQVQLGAKVAMLSQAQLRERFPFMKLDDVVCGTIGLENEGVIDGWQLLQAIREKNASIGVQYLKVVLLINFLSQFQFQGTVDSFVYRDIDYHRGETNRGMPPLPEQEDAAHVNDVDDDYELNRPRPKIFAAHIRPTAAGVSPRPLRASCYVNAAGPWAGDVARLAGIGRAKKGMMSVPLPVEKRCVACS